MKFSWMITLAGSLSLLFSGTVLAHDNGYGHGHGNPQVGGGAAFWVDSYGNVQYTANVAVGTRYAYAPGPYYGDGYGRRCEHTSHYAYDQGYNRGYKHGKKKGRKHRHKHRHDGHRNH